LKNPPHRAVWHAALHPSLDSHPRHETGRARRAAPQFFYTERRSFFAGLRYHFYTGSVNLKLVKMTTTANFHS
jgi:hypothetical protein